MDNQGTYLTIEREDPQYRPVAHRIKDFHPVKLRLHDDAMMLQAHRCLDCGVPFCHMYGCPLGNRVPDYSDLVAMGRWREALDILHSTNNFPEITGRICPALCEASCTLAVNFTANSCQQLELAIAEKGWELGWITPEIPKIKSGRRVAVVGSGPAGLCAAQQLARHGHDVVVFEKADRIGGMLMYGIPNFKLEKEVLGRRLSQLEQEGVVFETNVEVGKDLSAGYLQHKFDAVILSSGTSVARDLSVPGRSLEGLHLALEYLTQQTKLVLNDHIDAAQLIEPKGKHVVVIGGGDTGADCVGSVIRRGCLSVTQIELLPMPPEQRQDDNPWPQWPKILRTSSSHLEGVRRLWGLGTTRFDGDGDAVSSVVCEQLDWTDKTRPVPVGQELGFPCELVLLSMGFVPDRNAPLIKEFSLKTDRTGNIATDDSYRTSNPKVFAAGDAVSGASLVVRAIAHGRACGESVHEYLTR